MPEQTLRRARSQRSADSRVGEPSVARPSAPAAGRERAKTASHREDMVRGVAATLSDARSTQAVRKRALGCTRSVERIDVDRPAVACSEPSDVLPSALEQLNADVLSAPGEARASASTQ